MKKIIATTAAPAAIGPYSQGIDGGSTVATVASCRLTPPPVPLPRAASPGRPASP